MPPNFAPTVAGNQMHQYTKSTKFRPCCCSTLQNTEARSAQPNHTITALSCLHQQRSAESFMSTKTCCYDSSYLRTKSDRCQPDDTMAVLYCTVLYCTVSLMTLWLYCTVLYCTVLYCTVLYCQPDDTMAVLYCTVLYCTVLYCTVLSA
jgi:hypothetical protein